MRKKIKKQRPINLNLYTMRFPITAISSILHRISGVIIFFVFGIILWLLNLSLSSPEGFLKAASIMDSVIAKFAMWNILTIFAYHIISGIRYILIDFGFLRETLAVGIRSSQVVFIFTIILSILSGVLVW